MIKVYFTSSKYAIVCHSPEPPVSLIIVPTVKYNTNLYVMQWELGKIFIFEETMTCYSKIHRNIYYSIKHMVTNNFFLKYFEHKEIFLETLWTLKVNLGLGHALQTYFFTLPLFFKFSLGLIFPVVSLVEL